VDEQSTNRYFDELASGLASGSLSRGKALKLIGAALLGGTLASVPGVAWGAKPPGNQGCPIAGQVKVKGQCICEGTLFTPVGGGDPICFCGLQCQASCADCPEGQVCIDGACGGGGVPETPATCVRACTRK
jgi:hypothetical protein